MTLPFTETVGWSAAVVGATDPYGQPTTTWPVTVDVPGSLVAPAAGNEGNLPERQAVEVVATVYLPKGAPVVGSRDRLTVRGDDYDVSGQPGTWLAPGDFDQVVNLKRTEG